MHIPKTAGTTVRALLEERFEASCVLPSERSMNLRWSGNYPPIPVLLELPQERWDSTQLLRGHYPWQVAQRFSRPPIMLTMLREPVARCVSHLRHVQRTAEWAADKSLAEVLERRPFAMSALSNIQTRMLANRFDLSDPEQWPKDINRPMALDRALLTRAIETLKSFHFVGLQEDFENSMRLMFHLFGWQKPDRFLRYNTSAGDPEVDDELVAQLTEYNRFDIELYAAAERLFAERLKGVNDSEIAAERSAAE